ncbi:MAG: hypothetical protein KatS3mg027_0306 [Bacteroidia bacterium]|nr:MAG: hypothetical protein KatS3mg027_0306 [Bacteroidia bacterium]
MRKIILGIVFVFILVISFNFEKSNIVSLKELKYPLPPGTMQLDSNLYFDETEITNFSYLEFVYWIKKVYGSNSQEYKSVLPDTNVWKKLGKEYERFVVEYFRHPQYRSYPVVGITYEQALKFSKWRSDRVMEFILIKHKIIPFIPNPHKDSAFTIERYFEGRYYNIKPDKRFNNYPYYFLPDSATFQKAFKFQDSVMKKSKTKKKCSETIGIHNLAINCHNITTRNLLPTSDLLIGEYCECCKESFIANLKGNVRELTAKEGVFFGHSFMDTCDKECNVIREDKDMVNAYTGFRNACVYKRWSK